MSDGFKYVEILYKTSQENPSFKVELQVTAITGKVVFSILYYSDEERTQYLGETSPQDVVIDTNIFDSGPLQYENLSLYVIGRIKILQGSELGFSSFKINDISHIERGGVSTDNPPLSFTQNIVNEYVYRTVQLGLILDPSFQIALQVQILTGVADFEYFYYTDEYYTQLSSIQKESILVGNNIFQVNTVNKYVILQIKMINGSRILLDSLNLQQVSQNTKNDSFTTPSFIDDTIVVSETCFPSGTLVKSDQGTIPIQHLVPHYHTIQGKSVVAITSTYSSDKEMVSIRKDSIRRNYPNSDTLISKKHKIYMKGKLKAAYRLAESYKGVTLVPYKGQVLYNVLLEDYGLMNIHGLLCETLHPLNPMATLFREIYRIDSHTDKRNKYPNKIETRESFLVQ